MTGDGHSGPNGKDHGDSHDDGDDDLDSGGYGPGEGYYPDGGYDISYHITGFYSHPGPNKRIAGGSCVSPLPRTYFYARIIAAVVL